MIHWSKETEKTALVVEDQLATWQALADSLRPPQYQVIEAENGRQALAILEGKANQIDLVFSDAVTPEMGGMALFHAMQQRCLNIPLFVLTDHPLRQQMEQLIGQGLSTWAPKPISLEELAHLPAELTSAMEEK